MAIPELAAKGVFSSKEIYPYIGLLAYWYEIISVIVLVILIVEIVCSLIASKKLADKIFRKSDWHLKQIKRLRSIIKTKDLV